MRRRVVVTGMGVVSPVGTGCEAFWRSLLEGRSGIRTITHFETGDLPCKIGGMVEDFKKEDHFSSKEARHLATFIQYALVASREAFAMAGLERGRMDPHRLGVLIGSGIGSLNTLETEYRKFLEKGARRLSPYFIPRMIINEAAGHVAIEWEAKAFASCVATACATATNAIGDAMRIIQMDEADVVVAGGAEHALTPLGIGGFCALKALSTRNDDPQRASRPFDKERDGFVMASGAGVVVVEALDHAESRGAGILAELVGYGRTSDAYHVTAPEPTGMGAARAMRLAMEEAGLAPKDVGYINAHGTSTYLNDKVETMAIKAALGEEAVRVPVSSTKSMTGHLLGAAGAVELIACILALRDQTIPPTINYDHPDPECDLDYVPNAARKVSLKSALSNSLGFGGHNATLAVKIFEH